MKGGVHIERAQWAQKEEANQQPHTLLDSLTIVWLV